MKMHALKSNAIRGYGYDDASHELVVKFSGGGMYRYKNVPPEIAHGLGSAASAGAYIATRIKGQFEHTRHKAKARK